MKQLTTISEKLKGLSPSEIAAEALLRSRRRISRAYRRAVDKPESTRISDEDLKRSLGGEPLARLFERMRKRKEPHLTAGLADLQRTVDCVKQLLPDAVEEARREADQIVAHRMMIFGRPFDFGPLIDWQADPATKERWPFDHFTRVPLRLRQGTDVRAVWELNRLYHFTALGRAYALTGDERYAEEFLIQLASWYEDNPPRFGVNWTVAMEAAIRAINILAAFDLFRASPQMSDDAMRLVLKTLLAHGRFIRANLEFSHCVSSNHYLSDLIGLFAIGMMVPDFRESSEWVSYSAPRLLEEMNKQVLPDGVDYEGSTGYHRLVLEIFALFFSLSYEGEIELPGEHWQRLEAMFEFTRHYLKPDGSAPLIGDTDDGRIIKFRWRPAVDHSYLMPLAAVLLENETFKGSNRLDEEALWWFGERGREVFEGLPINEEGPQSRAFPDAQIFVERAGPLYAIIDCGDHGARGRGSHAHSDALSLELFAFDTTFLRDPGTFVYTANERWRNAFRSTAYHNTVRVDGHEISPASAEQLFALGENVRPKINHWESTAERDVLDAEHAAYERLDEPVTHRRIITFDKRGELWIIEDLFRGAGEHEFEIFFNFDSGLKLTIEADDRARVTSEQSALAIVPVSKHSAELRESKRWVSLSYGTRELSSGIIYRFYARVPFENMIMLIPYRLGDESKVEAALRERGLSESGAKAEPDDTLPVE